MIIYAREIVCVRALERFPREIIPRVHSTSAIDTSVYAYACGRIRRRTNARKTRCCYNFCNQTGRESYRRFLFDPKYFSAAETLRENNARCADQRRCLIIASQVTRGIAYYRHTTAKKLNKKTLSDNRIILN